MRLKNLNSKLQTLRIDSAKKLLIYGVLSTDYFHYRVSLFMRPTTMRTMPCRTTMGRFASVCIATPARTKAIDV